MSHALCIQLACCPQKRCPSTPRRERVKVDSQTSSDRCAPCPMSTGDRPTRPMRPSMRQCRTYSAFSWPSVAASRLLMPTTVPAVDSDRCCCRWGLRRRSFRARRHQTACTPDRSRAGPARPRRRPLSSRCIAALAHVRVPRSMH